MLHGGGSSKYLHVAERLGWSALTIRIVSVERAGRTKARRGAISRDGPALKGDCRAAVNFQAFAVAKRSHVYGGVVEEVGPCCEGALVHNRLILRTHEIGVRGRGARVRW